MRFLHTMIRVTDLEKTLHFFESMLGMTETRRIENEKGRFTLVFLAASDDVARGKAEQAPLVELTYNWDPEDYKGGRNFGHLAYEVDDILRALPKADGRRRHHQPPASRRPHGFCAFAGQYFARTSAEGWSQSTGRTLGLDEEYGRVVTRSSDG